MPLASDQLPNDVAELKRLFLAKDAELSAAVVELAAAKNGLVITQLTRVPNGSIAAHVRSSSNRKHTTVRERMPSSHRCYADWTPEQAACRRDWAQHLGPDRDHPA
jgi:hypothetical protein